MSTPLWRPDPERVARTSMEAFRRSVASRRGVPLEDSAALHRWSVEDRAAFWSDAWDFLGVVASCKGPPMGTVPGPGPGLGADWFPEARLNFAENLLRRRDDAPAVVFQSESRVRTTLSFGELADRAARCAGALARLGVGPGDRVAAYLPNIPETVVAMLGAATVGAVFSSCSPDFGVAGVVDRFGQIEPKVLFAPARYFYNGKSIACMDKVREIASRLPSVERVVLVPYPGDESPEIDEPRYITVDQFLMNAPLVGPAHLPFLHPLYILYSSGTTGVPKCIVHSSGGTLIQHLKEHQLHTDIRRDDRVFYFTTCGWMMWNWLVSALASEATIVLFDGSPFHPDARALWDLARDERLTHFGASAKYLDACRKSGVTTTASHDLSALRVLCSTGSPLSVDGFHYVYESIKSDVQLASISGGTDIVSCFVLGDPTGPVHAGECQMRGLGMDVRVYDDDARELVGRPGDLVCVPPFPSMPIGFFGDVDGSRYRAAYFERFPGIWCHGDWVQLTEHGGMIIHGRSDATLKPGGVRIGTAEIYRPVESLEEIAEALAIGQEFDGDTRIVLFVRLRESAVFDGPLISRIQQVIRRNATPRHVPSVVLAVDDLPRTKSGKIAELAVRDVVHGRPVRNTEALANPESLEQFRNRPELRA